MPADDAGLFAAAGSCLARLGRRPGVLLAMLLGLVAVVTALLNLDTAVVFLTPVLVHAARRRGVDERPFVYGTVFMSNSASLLLPGSNLTNVMVQTGDRLPALHFARAMALPWGAAVLLTAALIGLLHAPVLRKRAIPRGVEPRVHARHDVAAVALALAVVLVLLDAALATLALGAGVTVLAHGRRSGMTLRAVRDALPLALAPLFMLAATVGAVAHLAPVSLPSAGAGAAGSVALGAVGALTLNNLPATALLSAHHAAHPLFLLLGLDIGPNLFITGSLSAVLWRRIAQRNGATVSVMRYLGLGLLLTPIVLAAAAALLSVSPGA